MRSIVVVECPSPLTATTAEAVMSPVYNTERSHTANLLLGMQNFAQVCVRLSTVSKVEGEKIPSGRFEIEMAFFFWE